MPFRRTAPVVLALAALVAAACDDDPNAPENTFSFNGCPAPGTRLDVNAPIALEFSDAVSPTSVSSANIVVTNAETGLTVPGALNLSPDGTTITFDPDAPLPFNTALRVRIQNVLAAETNFPADLVVCQLLTQEPEITSTPWEAIGPATGTRLFGASLTGPDEGYVLSSAIPLLRRIGDEFQVVYANPYFAQAYDVAFLDDNDQFGWVTYLDLRQAAFGSRLLQTTNGAVSFEEIFGVNLRSLNRIFMRRTTAPDSVFAVVGGGNIDNADFHKYNATARTFATVANFTGTSEVRDIDFGPSGAGAADTTLGVGASFGVRFNDVTLNPGKVFVSSNGGSSWAEATAAAGSTESTVASFNTTFYMGAAVGSGGTLWVTGGSGTVKRLAPAGGTSYTVTRVLENRVNNPDPIDPEALIYTDVEFAPENRMIGWVVGAQRIGVVGGVPQYRGLIFETQDGGATWIRQGVANAPNYGAEFPRLNRLEVRSATEVWIVGDGGAVFSYAP